VRQLFLLIVVTCALSVTGAASAHSTAPTVALDYRVQLSNTTETLKGVHVEVVDGDRAVRLQADPGVELVVEGRLGEPFLRFSSTGIWVNQRSPTASAIGLVPADTPGSGWIRVGTGRTFVWHDHRLTPPPNLKTGASGTWSLPIELDGHPVLISGVVTRVAPPPLWPWVAALLIGISGIVALWRLAPTRRGELVVALAGVGAMLAVVSNLAIATGDILGTAAWQYVGLAGFLALAAGAAFFVKDSAARAWSAAVIGPLTLFSVLAWLPVFWHGVVIASLPATIVRLAIAVTIVASGAAMPFGLFAGEQAYSERSVTSALK
jgi:hypothetical protein